MEGSPGEEPPETVAGEEFESDDEALSFSDLPVTEECDSQWKYVQSPRGSPQGHFEFSRSNSASHEQQDSSEICPADDLFCNGQLLPLSSSLRSQSQGRAFKPSNCRARDYHHHYSRTASLDSQCSGSSYWGSSRGSRSSGFSDSADRNAAMAHIGAAPPDSVAPSKAESVRSARRPPAANNRLKLSCKTSIKWQFFTLGLIKIPEMRMDDIRLRSYYGGIPRPANPSPDDGPSCPNSPNVLAQKAAKERAPAAEKNNNNNNNHPQSPRRTQNVPSDCKGWRIFRSIVSYRIGCGDSCGVDTVSAPRKPTKCSGDIFYSAELNLRFVSNKKSCRDSPRRASNPPSPNQTKGSVPNFISSAISLCKQCHAVEPEIVCSTTDFQRFPKESL